MVSTMGRLTCFTTSKIVKGVFLPVALMFCKLRANEATDYFLPSSLMKLSCSHLEKGPKKSDPYLAFHLVLDLLKQQCNAPQQCTASCCNSCPSRH